MFFGREELIERLEGLFKKKTSSLVTCRGRRRIGKSTLIEKFAERARARFIKIEGIKPRAKLDNRSELENFAIKLAAQTHCDSSVPDGSFYGRRSLDIVVPELPIWECVRFWGKAAARTDPREILDVLSVTGGVPRYLEEIDSSVSAAEVFPCVRRSSMKAILRQSSRRTGILMLSSLSQNC